MLDRNRYYAIVYGDPVAKHYQDGKFYRGDGTLISSGKEPSPVKEEHQAQVVEQKKDAPADDLTAKLNGMTVPALKKVAAKVAKANEAELPEFKGKGVKVRLIAYIADNTV